MPRPDRSPFLVAAAAFTVFILPMALFLFKFRFDAPFYFLAQDSFYYLSIALHSAHTPFFSIDGLHPTNGFHPLWECLEYTLSRLPYFHLDGPDILPRIFAVDLVIVSTAVALLAAFVQRLTRRPWLSILAVCPGFLWLLVGIGAPAYLNFWASVNGMETGLELVFFSLVLLLWGTASPSGTRLLLAAVALGGLVLSRLDDVFFLLGVAAVFALHTPAQGRLRRLAPLAVPLVMIAGYLMYNHHTVGVWMPVSGMAKAGKGYRAGIGESVRLLTGWPFFALPSWGVAFNFSNTFVMIAQMFAPMMVAALFLLWCRGRTQVARSLLQGIAVGVLLKGGYNFLRVPVGYQGAWYYGASIATANILLAVMASEALGRLSATSFSEARATSPLPPAFKTAFRFAATLGLAFLSFNITAARASDNGFAPVRDAWLERAHLAATLRAATPSPFLEFQDGELSFATGLPSVSGFGLAADPEAVRAQHNGTFFDLLARRGVTIAAASNTYPAPIAASAQNKGIFPIWGYNRREIQGICFQPFWSDPVGNIVLYRILRQPTCPAP